MFAKYICYAKRIHIRLSVYRTDVKIDFMSPLRKQNCSQERKKYKSKTLTSRKLKHIVSFQLRSNFKMKKRKKSFFIK